MIRKLSLATIFATALALPALAEDAKKVEPATAPTSTVTDQVPQMKSDAQAVKDAGANSTKPLPATKATGDALPAMRPGDAATGATSAQAGPGISLTEQESKNWIDKPVYSSDGKNVGEVVSIQRDPSNKVTGMHADIGGYWGFGQTRIELTSAQFKLQGDRVLLDLTSEQAKAVPAT